MKEAVGASYCNHLRDQLREWQRGFKARTGRQPTLEDFDALQHDSSARGKLVHGAYLALNRSTGGSFAKSLKASAATQNMVIVGGPRQTTTERRHAQALAAAASAPSGTSSCGKREGVSRSGFGGAPVAAKPDNPLSRHLALMERLKPKVQQRSISRSSSAGGKNGGGGGDGGTVNAVLAAGDGHRRADAGRNRSGTDGHNHRLEGTSAAAGVTVSRRARAMGATATAAMRSGLASKAATAPLARREKDPPTQDSRHRGRRGDAGGASKNEGDAGGAGGDGRRVPRKAQRARQTTGYKGAVGGCSREAPAIENGCGPVRLAPSESSDRFGGSSGEARDPRKGEEDAPTPERKAAHRRAAVDLLPARTRTKRVAASFDQDSSASSSSVGVPTNDPKKETKSFRRGGPQGKLPHPSASVAWGNSKKDMSHSKLRAGFSMSGGRGDSNGNANGNGNGGTASRLTITDEVGLAVAMTDIMSNSSVAAVDEPDPEKRRKGSGSKSVLSLATRIVNTTGTSGSVGGRGCFPSPSASDGRVANDLSSLSHSAHAWTKGAAATTAVVAAAASSDSAATVVCGPGMVAPSGRRESAAGSDWHLRALRAVERAREERKDNVPAPACSIGTGPPSSVCDADAGRQPGGDAVAIDQPELADTNALAPRQHKLDRLSQAFGQNGSGARSEENARASRKVTPNVPRDPLSESAATERKVKIKPDGISNAVLHLPTARAAHPTRRVRDSDAESSDEGAKSDPGEPSTALVEKRPVSATPRPKATVDDIDLGARGTGASVGGVKLVGGVKRSVGGARKKAVQKTEVSDNFVRMDLKSKGSSRFKRKGSGRNRARGGSGGRRFEGGGGQWAKGGRGYRGNSNLGPRSSKWGGKGGFGREDPVTGEKGGVRDRPVSSGAAKSRAGLDVLDQCLDALGAAGVSGGGGVKSGSPSFQLPRNAREEEELLLRLAPRCPQHQRAGKLLTVRKTGLNKGRKFYVCSLPRGEGCDFFMWADDNPALVLGELTLRENAVEWRRRKAACWEKAFLKLPIPELKKELKKRRLSCGGKKENLIQRLVGHAVAELESSTTACVATVQEEGKASEPSSASRLGDDGGDIGSGIGLEERVGECQDGYRRSSDGEVCDNSDSESEFEFAFADDATAVAVANPAAVEHHQQQWQDVEEKERGIEGEKLMVQSAGDGVLHPSEQASTPPPQQQQQPLEGVADDVDSGDSRLRGGKEKPSTEVLEGDCCSSSGGGKTTAASLLVPEEDGKRGENRGGVRTKRGRLLGAGSGEQRRVVDAGGEGEDSSGEDEQQEEDQEQEPEWASLVESDDDSDSDGLEDGDGEDACSVDGLSSGEEPARCTRRTACKKRRKLGPQLEQVGGVSKRTDIDSSAEAAANGNDEGEDIGLEAREDAQADLPGSLGERQGEGSAADRSLTPATALKRVFGHETFREGQKWGIDRALKGKRTLLVLATGTGKSLVYQLPALLLPGITVVVSPLVSLMEDQMARLPPQLPGASLSGSHGGLREVATTVRDLRAGRVKVLFLSPEKLCSPSFRRLASTPGVLPHVSLLCVDEAHCVSQWSHNFRPSYLRLGQALELLRPKGVLALTATASKAVVADIQDTLAIPEDGIKIGSWDRPNLRVSISKVLSDDDKRETLSRLLGEAPLDAGSVVVYVWRQATAEALCALLRGEGHDAVAYHGGMEAGARERAQTAFTRGRARVVVATVAFGLGVDMREIRGVVHFDMPKSIENYVQEIGRAGRDGRAALCVLLLCDQDFVVHHALAHSKGLEIVQVRGLLRAIVGDASQGLSRTADGGQPTVEGAHQAQAESVGFQKALSVCDLEARLDIGGEVVETVLSVLEGEPYRLVKLHAIMDDNLHVHFRKRRPSTLAAGEPVIGLLLAMGSIEGLSSSVVGYSYGHGSAKMSLVRLAEALGWEPTAVVRELRRLQFMGEVEYTLSRRSFHVTLLRELSSDELEKACVELHRNLAKAESLEAEKVEAVYRALASEEAAARGDEREPPPPSINDDDTGNKRSDRPPAAGSRPRLHATISRYFDEDSDLPFSADAARAKPPDAAEAAAAASSGPKLPHQSLDKRACEALARDAAVLVSDPSFRGRRDHSDGFQDDGGWRGARVGGVGGDLGGMAPHAWLLKDVPMLSRAVTRVFHGIGSVSFPASWWRESAFWGRYRHHSFRDVKSKLEIALAARR